MPFAIALTGILLIVGVWFLFTKGFSMLVTYFALIVALLLGFFYQQPIFIGTIIFSLLIINIGTQTGALLHIWFTSPKIDQTVQFFVQLGFIKSAIIVFFILSTIDILLYPVNFFRLNITNTNNELTGTRDKKPKKTQPTTKEEPSIASWDEPRE